MLKIFHVSAEPDFPWRFLRGQIKFMKEHGFDVHVVSSPNDYLEKIRMRDQVPVHGIPISRKITPFFDLFSIFALWKLFLREQPDIIHAHTPKGGVVALVAAWLARVPVRIYHVHGLAFLSAGGVKRLILRYCDKLTCLLSSQVFCVSHSNMHVAIAMNICPKSKIKVIQNGSIDGVDAGSIFNPEKYDDEHRIAIRSQYGIGNDKLVIGFVGRLLMEKGIFELHDAWQEIKVQYQNVELFIVGPIDDRNPVSSHILASFKSDKYVNLTECWQDFMPPYYSAMDILVLPSYREGLGLVSLEAGAMNIPVIATNIPGCIDAIEDGVTGKLVPPRDAKSLAAAIIDYINNPMLREKHGIAGRQRVIEKFSRIPIWEETLGLYNLLLNTVRKRV